jgi:hypothetical protein
MTLLRCDFVVFTIWIEFSGGVSVIRAFGLTEEFKRANKNKIDKNIRDQYLQKYLYAYVFLYWKSLSIDSSFQ